MRIISNGEKFFRLTILSSTIADFNNKLTGKPISFQERRKFSNEMAKDFFMPNLKLKFIIKKLDKTINKIYHCGGLREFEK